MLAAWPQKARLPLACIVLSLRRLDSPRAASLAGLRFLVTCRILNFFIVSCWQMPQAPTAGHRLPVADTTGRYSRAQAVRKLRRGLALGGSSTWPQASTAGLYASNSSACVCSEAGWGRTSSRRANCRRGAGPRGEGCPQAHLGAWGALPRHVSSCTVVQTQASKRVAPTTAGSSPPCLLAPGSCRCPEASTPGPHLHVALQPAHSQHNATQRGAAAIGARISHVSNGPPGVGLQREDGAHSRWAGM